MRCNDIVLQQCCLRAATSTLKVEIFWHHPNYHYSRTRSLRSRCCIQITAITSAWRYIKRQSQDIELRSLEHLLQHLLLRRMKTIPLQTVQTAQIAPTAPTAPYFRCLIQPQTLLTCTRTPHTPFACRLVHTSWFSWLQTRRMSVSQK